MGSAFSGVGRRYKNQVGLATLKAEELVMIIAYEASHGLGKLAANPKTKTRSAVQHPLIETET